MSKQTKKLTTDGASRRDILLGCLCAAGCEAIFGLSFAFTKSATGEACPLALLGWRFAVAAVVMAVLAASGAIRVRFWGRRLGPLARVAVLFPVLYFICETFGIARTGAAESGVLLACIPVVVLVASAKLLGERPSRRQIVGIFITLTGVLAAVSAAGTAVTFSPAGYAFLLGAVAAYTLYCVAARTASKEFSGAELTLAMLATGAAVFAPLAIADAAWHGGGDEVAALMRLPLENRRFLSAVLFQGLGASVLGFFLSNLAIAKAGVNRTASFIGVATSASIVAGVCFLGEDFGPVQAGAAALIIVGVWIANRVKAQRMESRP